MKIIKKYFPFLILSVALLIMPQLAEAQCAMCRAAVENNVSNGDVGIAAKLNAGIIYLFAAPYLAFIVIAIFWYRNSRENRRKAMLAASIRNRIQRI
ncbi:MAG: hypothetical protein ACFCUU_03070 [Cyclobacteriaceae bacterium]